MANVLKNPSHVDQSGYNGFDMSQLLKFSSTVGELLPVYYDLLYPGDKVTCKSILKTRTQPLRSAAMTHIEEHIDWFAVPLDQIYSLSSAFLYNVDDVHTSMFVNSNINKSKLPYISGASFLSYLSFTAGFPGYDSYFSSQNGFVPTGLAYNRTYYRLFELLGIPVIQPLKSDGTVDSTISFNMSINPMFACAYQKIYYDYFRVADREVNYPEAYNLDRFYNSVSITDVNSIAGFFTLRYRPWSKDFFTHIYVSPLFGINSQQSLGQGASGANYLSVNDLFHQWLTSIDLSTYGPDVTSASSIDSSAPTQVSHTWTSGGVAANQTSRLVDALSPTSIRTSFAVQKLLEITRRAGKHLDKQTLAHFGINPDSKLSGEVIHLGHTSNVINIGDVISTADTANPGYSGGAFLGQISGKGYGYGESKPIKFFNDYTCPVILMAVYSAEPSMDYMQRGLDRLNTYIDKADFFLPALDNLNMQPLFGYQCHFMSKSTEDLLYNTRSVGWQFRWMESKLKYNRICGMLARSMRDWTTYRSDQTSALSSFLVSPFSLNSIMEASYQFDGLSVQPIGDTIDLNDGWQFDPLFHELYFDVKKATKMSAYGLETL